MAPPALLELAHLFGDPSSDLCILAEGNVSCHSKTPGQFWIKGSGVQMGSMSADGFVEVRRDPVVNAFGHPAMSEEDARSVLNSARVDPSCGHVPSTEAFMHAYLLGLEGVNYVGHAHPAPLLSLLLLTDAAELAGRRWFPDEVVCCGPASCYVPYVAPGLPLALAMRPAVERYREKWGFFPRTIWLQNHGLICLGSTAGEIRSAALMSVKAARVVLGALQTGREVVPLSPGQVKQVMQWPDEAYRAALLRG